MASRFPVVGGAPHPSLVGVQGKGLTAPSKSTRLRPKETNRLSEYKVHDIANRLGSIQLTAANRRQQDAGLYPVTIDSPSWVTTQTTSINIRCSCGNVGRQLNHHGNHTAQKTTHSSDSDSEEESDDESFSLENLLRILRARNRDGKGMQGKKAGATLRNLVKSYNCGVDNEVADSALTQLLNLTDSNVCAVKEAALLTLGQVCSCKANAQRLIEWKTVRRLLILLDESYQPDIVPAVAQALQQLTFHQELKDEWLELMITDGLAVIIGRLQGQPSDEGTVIAMANLLAQLAKYFELAVLILDHCMYQIMAAWKSYSVLKAPILSVLKHLVSHNEHTTSVALEREILHYASIILKESDCSCQVSAMELYLQLSQSPYGLSALLEENKLTLALRVTMATHCREVRKLGLSTLEKTLELGTPSQVKELLLQLAEYLDQESTTGIHADGSHQNGKSLGTHKEQQQYLGGKRKHAQDRVEKGVRYISQILVHCLHKEGKISLDSHGVVQSVGFKPNVDQYMCLSYAANCVFYIATLPVHRPRTRTSSNKSQAARNKKRHPNIITTQYMIESGALCLVHILCKYTTYLTSQGALPTLSQPQSTQHRNLDVLYLKATMKLWQQQSESLKTRKRMCDVLSTEEVKFLQQVLQAVEVIAKCCAEVWNQGIEDEIQEDMKRYQAWEGAGDSGSGSIPYQYVETIDQAFHASHANRSKMNSGSSNTRKVAWGDSEDGHVHQRRSPKKNGGDSLTSTRWKTLSWKQDDGVQLGHSTGGENQELSSQKKIRLQLFKTGVCSCVGSLLMSDNTQIQVSSLEVLRCLAQPFHEKEVSEKQESSRGVGGLPKMQSKASLAESLAERDRILSLVLQEMSSSTASVVKEALKTGNGRQTKSRPNSATRPTSSIRPSSAKYPQSKIRPNSGIRPTSAKSATSLHSTSKPTECQPSLPLTLNEPMYWQCTMYMLETFGQHFVHMLTCEDIAVARVAMLLLYDIVTFGEVIVHMKLASLGVITILMQIISQHIDAKDLPLLGLMTLQQVVASEYRIKQLFMAEGGKEFLERNAQTSQGALRAHIDHFLNFMSQSGPSLY